VSAVVPLRVLHLEDDDDDAALVLRELERAGFEVDLLRADHGPSFTRALDLAAARADALGHDSGYGALALDVVLGDFVLPGYDGLAALAALRARDPEVPFIFVSGVSGEDRALAALRAGARDFVLKNRLSLLGPAVARELEQRAQRRGRMQAERALHREAVRKRALFESAPVSLVEVDANDLLRLLRREFGGPSPPPGVDVRAWVTARPGRVEELARGIRIVDVNEETARILELPSKEALLGDLATIASGHGGVGPTVAALIAAIAEGGGRFVTEVDYRTFRGRSGRGLVGVQLPGPGDEDGRFVSSMLDLTPQRRLEEQVQNTRRVASVGALAAGVAHDFNNLLSVITGHLEFLRESLEGDAQSSRDLDVALEAAGRAAALTRQLLGFARQPRQHPRVLEPLEVIERTRQLLARTLGEHIDVVVKSAGRPGAVYLDPSQLEQILVNLSVNARDAMPRGGTLTITTDRVDVPVDDPRVRSGALVAGDYVRVSVEDTGEGMDPATLERIFEPLFTTKPSGHGTGLGLATVHAIVTAAGGWIGVDSRPGAGSRFDVLLPSAGEPVAPERKANAVCPSENTGRILLVEDDPLVRATARRILERAGYLVTECASPAEAIAVAESTTTPFDLLLTDVVMPGMHGADLARRLHAEGCVTRVVLMSGYAPSDLGVLPGPLLPKPFTDRVLRAHVEAALRRDGSPSSTAAEGPARGAGRPEGP
jgi:signal transduction histidine kinase/DNA-binding response OmpR family regulator